MTKRLIPAAWAVAALSASTTVTVVAQHSIRKIVEAKYPDSVFIGATSGMRGDDQKKEHAVLNREFGYITPNNDFKQPLIHPEPGKWNWKLSDQWIESAKQHNQLIRLHAPVGPQCSKWVKDDSRTAPELLNVMQQYMGAVCRRYNDAQPVRWLDVVNEPIHDGEWFGPRPGDHLWENPWLSIGLKRDIPESFELLSKKGVPIYIIRSFEIADKNAPRLKLIINQHQLFDRRTPPENIGMLKELVLYLRSRGLRVDGIGWQGHIRAQEIADWAHPDGKCLRNLAELIDWAHRNDLEFHVTENDIHVPTGFKDMNAVAQVYANILACLLEKRQGGVVAWNLWTLSDKPHWKDKESTRVLGLWDSDLKPTPAHDAVLKSLLKNAGRTDPNKN